MQNASSLILGSKQTENQNGAEVDDTAMQSLLDLMNESGLEWPGNLFDLETDFTADWDSGGAPNV